MVINASILFFLLFALLYLMWPSTWWPIQCIELKEPIRILNAGPIHPGDEIEYEIVFNKKTDRPSMVSRQIVNDRIFNFVDIPSSFPKGEDKIRVQIKLPITASKGQHNLIWGATYQLPFRTVTYRFMSEPFYVTHNFEEKKK